MAVLGSVFDEEDVGDVRNAPTLTLLRAKMVEIRVLMLDTANRHTRMSPFSIYNPNR